MNEGLDTVPIAVNFSRLHVNEADFCERLSMETERAGVPHSLIHVGIDDFGSGWSSLSMVKNVDADILKIDRSLLGGNVSNDKDRIFLESIFDFANRLKLETVAEGVKTREQLGFLRTCGCQLIQGFLFAKPMPEDEFSRICSQQADVGISEDILLTQPRVSAMQLLTEVIFKKYPLVIFANLTRNSFYMMAYDNFSTRSCPASGVFDELIRHGASSMHPDDQQLFLDTFNSIALLNAYQEGKDCVRIVTRQLGDDGVYRPVETCDYFVKSPDSDDTLIIALSQTLEYV